MKVLQRINKQNIQLLRNSKNGQHQFVKLQTSFINNTTSFGKVPFLVSASQGASAASNNIARKQRHNDVQNNTYIYIGNR